MCQFWPQELIMTGETVCRQRINRFLVSHDFVRSSASGSEDLRND
jgi:hypothetical protein